MIPNYRNFFSSSSHERDLSGCRAAGSQAFTTQTHSRHVARTPNLHQHFVASSQFHGAGIQREENARERANGTTAKATHLYRSAYTYYKSASDTQPNLNFVQAWRIGTTV